MSKQIITAKVVNKFAKQPLSVDNIEPKFPYLDNTK